VDLRRAAYMLGVKRVAEAKRLQARSGLWLWPWSPATASKSGSSTTVRSAPATSAISAFRANSAATGFRPGRTSRSCTTTTGTH